MINLRPHQAEVVGKLDQGFSEHRCQLLYAPTGFGKTEVAMHMMVEEAKRGTRVAMVLDRIVLVNQTSTRLSKYGIAHGVMQSGHWRYRPYERIQVCSAQTLERRSDFPDVGLLIIDECFVAGTHIATPKGPVMIDHVRCGDLVYNQGGIGVVEAVSIKPATQTYRLEFDDGTVTQCTGNHPFFTERGWRAACQLEVGAYTFGLEGMRLLWESVQTLDSSGRKRQNQVGNAGAELEYAAQLLNILLEEVAEPYEQSSNAPEGECQAARDQAQTHQARRERAIAALASACVAARFGRGLGVGVSSSHKNGAALRLSQLLQAGLGQPKPHDRDRDRRVFAYDHRQEESGSEEDGSSCFPRLVSVSLIKRPSAVSVFNLQVSGHPSYFADGKLVHNCHVQRKQVIKYIQDNPDVRVIGLTATPFTKGLGDTYTNVVGAKPTGELIEDKWLVPLKIFIAKEIDMTGAKKVAGEWSQDEVSARGMKITGDIVDEWITKTHQLFGGPRKTVVFASGVEHGRDLVRQFGERGYNFVSISYKEEDDFKRETIEDFSRPDTKIVGLIATDILTRGFDVPDVMIGVSARPFSKSFSSHVQQMGRIMRPCEGKTHGIWLDHSGNYLRFRKDWDDLFNDGVTSLPEGAGETTKKEPAEKVKKESKCGGCGALWIWPDRVCGECGWTRPMKEVLNVPGKMMELEANSRSAPENQSFYSELLFYSRMRGYKDGWAAHKYKERYGVFPRGLGIDLKSPSFKTLSWIKSRNIAYAKARA